jgi:DNase/tRNase domain of colicin-like bacteriocin
VDPLTATALTHGTATASEAAAVASRTTEAQAFASDRLDGPTEADETGEVAVGRKGLLEQLNTIRDSSLESVAARNDLLLRTRNSELAGTVHPETEVPFVRDVVRLPDGTLREGVFPEFDAAFETSLPNALRQGTDFQQSEFCNGELRDAVDSDPALKSTFSDTEIREIGAAETPDGYTWHHHQDTGRMQLVDSRVHLATGHTGGKDLWGGGRPNR